MGRYINSEAVIVRLRGKVKTTLTPETEPDRMPMLLLNRLINEAEGQVEQDLCTRYEAPFTSICGGGFAALPKHPTQEIIRTLCELLAVIRVLETDFGRGSGLDGMKYADSSQKRYDVIIWGDEKKPGLCTIRENTFNTFRSPPLPGLKSNYHVSQADNGFAGYVGRTDDPRHVSAGFASEQINDPSQDYWNGFVGAADREPFDG